MKEKQKTWMALPTAGMWSDCFQIPLGEIEWDTAVAIAMAQEYGTVRLSLSAGYDNQGYYIHPNKC